MESLSIFSILISCLTLIAVTIAYFKLSKAIDSHGKKSVYSTENNFRQLESLLAIYQETEINHALPPTRGWAASPDFLRNLCISIAEKKPKIIVECSSGVSTLIAAACLKRQGNGHVYSLEHDPIFAENTRKALIRCDLSSWVTVIDAPLKKIELEDWNGLWYSTNGLPTDLIIDILSIDGPPGYQQVFARYPAIPILGKMLSNNATIILDDASRPDEIQIVKRWLTENELEIIDFTAECEKGCRILKIK